MNSDIRWYTNLRLRYHFDTSMSLRDYWNGFWYHFDVRDRFRYHFDTMEVSKLPNKNIPEIQNVWRIIKMDLDTLWYHFEMIVKWKFSIPYIKIHFNTRNTFWYHIDTLRYYFETTLEACHRFRRFGHLSISILITL